MSPPTQTVIAVIEAHPTIVVVPGPGGATVAVVAQQAPATAVVIGNGGTGGSGGVQGVSAADDTITIGGTDTSPTFKVSPGTFDVAGTAATQAAAAQAAAIAASSQNTAPTSTVQTGTVALSVAEMYPFDISSTNGIGNLPHAPADGTRIECKVVKINATPGTHTLTVNAAGGDVFDIAAGATSLTYSALHQGAIFQYKASTGIWYVTGTDAALAQPLGAAKLGSDGTVGGPSGSALAASVASVSSPADDAVPQWNGSAWVGAQVVGQGVQQIGVQDAAYAAPGNAKRAMDGAISASSNLLATAAWASFTRGMVVWIAGAGAIPSGSSVGTHMRAYAWSTSSSGVVLSSSASSLVAANAVNTVTAAQVEFGNSDNVAFAAAVAAAAAAGGGEVVISPSKNGGQYLLDVDATITTGSNYVQPGGSGNKFFYGCAVPSNVKVRTMPGVTVRFPSNATTDVQITTAFAIPAGSTNVELDVRGDGCANAAGPAVGQLPQMFITAVDSCDDIRLWNCRWHHFYYGGIFTYTGVSTTTNLTRVSIFNCGGTKNVGQGFTINNLSYSSIFRCWHHDQLGFVSGAGAQFESMLIASCSHLTIDGFESYNCGVTCGMNTVDHTIVRNVNGDSSISFGNVCSDVTIEGCNIDYSNGGTVGYAIGYFGGGPVSGVKILGNECLNGNITCQPTSTFTDLTVQNNTVRSTSSRLNCNFGGSGLTGANVDGNLFDNSNVTIGAGVDTWNGDTMINGGLLTLSASNSTSNGSSLAGGNVLLSVTGNNNSINGLNLTASGGGYLVENTGNNNVFIGGQWGGLQQMSQDSGNNSVYTGITCSPAHGLPYFNFYGTGGVAYANPGINTLGSGDYGQIVVAVTQSATPAIDTDSMTVASITALAQAITGFTITGTPVDGQSLLIRITDNGTVRAITWGSSVEAGESVLPTTTVVSTELVVPLVWNAVTSKWRCVRGLMAINNLADVASAASALANLGAAGVTTTQTLTNKRVTKRVLALSANSATPAVDTDNYDVVHITSQTATITGFTMTGTPQDGDTLRISITGTATVPFTLGSSFEASTIAVPTTTSGTARLDSGFVWNTETSKWRCVGVA